MADSMTNRYIPKIDQNENNLFVEEYYSSTDTKIYIDDIEQTEIGYLSYSLQEQLKPIYGYASNTFDDVAIGNRIVTGVIKIPIKNPNAQTSEEDIRNKNVTTSTIDDYNEKQDELSSTIDWITGDADINNSDIVNSTEDDETYQYKMKLIKLGYNLTDNSSIYEFKKELKKFQSDNFLNPDGNLNYSTKKTIDEAITKSSLPTKTLPIGTCLYYKPMLISDSIILQEDTTVYIIDDTTFDDGWVQIMLPTGETMYTVFNQEV
jgi:hypothetical protein